MYVLIAWNTKNGVPLQREALEVLSNTKLTVMNGGKMEPGATVNMLFKREIWGGTVQSIHDSKKNAEEELDREIGNVSEMEAVNTGDKGESSMAKRSRKRKSYGDDFEENEEQTTREETDESRNCSPTLQESNCPAKKNKKSPAGGKENKKRKTPSTEARQSITAQHDELVVTEILGACPTISEPAELTKLVIPAHPHFGGKEPKQNRPPPKCISVICREEKEQLTEELEETKKELADALEELRKLKALQPSSQELQAAKYGKVPRSVGIANNWEEISNGVWCCPIKVKAAVRNACTRTGLACSLLGIFYPKDKLKGMRLHELDKDIVEAITDFSMVAKLTKEPPVRKTKDGEEIVKPPSPVSRSTIKQAMRMKCNTLISLQKKQVASQAVATVTERA